MIPRSVYIAIAVAVALFGLYRFGFHNGWAERDADMQAEIAKKDAEAREIEHVMTGKINATAVKLEEANHAIDQKSSALDRAIRAGRVRLPAASCVQTTPDAPAAAPSKEDGSESDRQTLLLIAQIAADGDRAINSLNACVDAYNQVREQINGSNR